MMQIVNPLGDPDSKVVEFDHFMMHIVIHLCGTSNEGSMLTRKRWHES
jgi:hypothetical protein